MAEGIDLVTVGSLFVEATPAHPGDTLATAHAYLLVAGGAAANVVFALARLGVRVHFVTAVGDDEFGTLATETLAGFGVETRGVRRIPGQLTPVSFCSIDRQGGKQFRFYRFPGYSAPLQGLTAEDFRPARHCRLFDFSEGSIRDAALRALVFQAAREARQAGAAVLYAVNLRSAAWEAPEEMPVIQREAAALADIVVLNTEELAVLTGGDDPGALVRLGPRVVVVTAGGAGDILVRVGEAQLTLPPFRVPVVYDIGAGDTFHAGLVAAALRRDPRAMSPAEWREAARFAAAAAAIRVSTSADPADLPTYVEVERWLGERIA